VETSSQPLPYPVLDPSIPDWRHWLDEEIRGGKWTRNGWSVAYVNQHRRDHCNPALSLSPCGCCGAISVDSSGRTQRIPVSDGIKNFQNKCGFYFGYQLSAKDLEALSGLENPQSLELMDGDTPYSIAWKDE
jgi:hypothetical protein